MLLHTRVLNTRFPLVFFNGCSGDFYPFSAESVAGILLRNGNRGIVSTAVKTPDDVAAKFGRYFYLRLLTGMAVGDAVWRTKWDLLSSVGSPLGLLYSYNGNPELRVAPVPGTSSEWAFPPTLGGWKHE
jgi:hypothetical protein